MFISSSLQMKRYDIAIPFFIECKCCYLITILLLLFLLDVCDVTFSSCIVLLAYSLLPFTSIDTTTNSFYDIIEGKFIAPTIQKQ